MSDEIPRALPANPGPNAETRALLELFESQNARPFEELGVLRARRVVELSVALQGERLPVGSVEDLLGEGADGSIPIRLYRPKIDAGNGMMLVYLHGGGWSTGSVEVADRPCRMLAAATGAVVASVEYRRAPESPFPAPLEDCYAALQWLAAEAPGLGRDPARIVLIGDSAGANLAAATTLLTRERGGHTIAHQILLYPCLYPAEESPFASYRENAAGFSLTAASMEWFWSLYLARPDDSQNPLAAPLRAKDLAGLPPATVVTAELDPLRDEGIAYAKNLRRAGVDVDLLQYPGTIHGFFWMAGHLSQASRLAESIGSSLRTRFSGTLSGPE